MSGTSGTNRDASWSSRAAAKAEKAYQERDLVVAFAAHLAYQQGLEVWWGRVNDPLPGFQYAVYLELPDGQVSWHMRDDELPLFEHLPFETGQFQGGRRKIVDKYAAIAAYCRTHGTEGQKWQPKGGENAPGK